MIGKYLNHTLIQGSSSSSIAVGRWSCCTASMRWISLFAGSETPLSSRYFTFPAEMRRQSSCSLPALKGKTPTSMRQSSIPSAHISAFAPLQGLFLTIYGHMQAGVPQKLLSRALEFALNPKSIIFTCPLSSTKMFYGFKSRWQTPFSWQQETPSSISLKYFLATPSVKTLSFLRSPPRLCFPAFSITKYSLRRSRTSSYNLTTRSLSRFLRCLIYRLMQARRFQSRLSSFSQALIAKDCWLDRLIASDTVEKAPLPMWDISFSYFNTSLSERYSSKYPTFSPMF